MPRPANKNETTDLHAPWWSPKRTLDGTLNTAEVAEGEEGGRYLERWVVRAHMTEGNQQNISRQLEPRIKTRNKGAKRDESEIVVAEMPFARLYTLLEMTVEITDETGQPAHITGPFISSLDTADTEYVSDELDRIYNQHKAVEPTERDEDTARHSEGQQTAQEVAEARFRRTRPVALPR